MTDEEMKQTMHSLTEKVDQMAGLQLTLIQLARQYESRTAELEKSFQMLVALARTVDARLEAQNGSMAHVNTRIDALAGIQMQLAEAQTRLTEAQADSEKKIDALTDMQIRAEERWDERMSTLAEAQTKAEARQERADEREARLENRIDEFIAAVQRYIGGGWQRQQVRGGPQAPE